MLKPGVRRRVPVMARLLLLLLLVVGVSGMHSLAAGGSGRGTASSTSDTASTSAPGAAGMVVTTSDRASRGAVATESASHSMGHDCVAVLTDAPRVAVGQLLNVAAVPGAVQEGAPTSALSAVRAALDRAPLRPGPSLSELSILRV